MRAPAIRLRAHVPARRHPVFARGTTHGGPLECSNPRTTVVLAGGPNTTVRSTMRFPQS